MTLVKNVLLPAGDDGQVDQPERLLQADNVLRPRLLRILQKQQQLRSNKKTVQTKASKQKNAKEDSVPIKNYNFLKIRNRQNFGSVSIKMSKMNDNQNGDVDSVRKKTRKTSRMNQRLFLSV